jgi:hypothetical protein
MNHHDNKHCVEERWFERKHYRGNVCCGENDPFDRVELRVPGYWSSLDFDMPRQQHDLHKIEAMLEAAYKRGRADNRADLGRVLKEFIAV